MIPVGKIRLNADAPPPYGGPGGVAWDDGMYNGVREIIVGSGVHIDSIRVVYDKDGERVNANKHGGDGGNYNPEVTLTYPGEFLVSVSGTYFKGLIHSLKFKSNIRKFGPFGREVGTTFEFTVEDGGQIVGMKGRSDRYLNAIGVHISCAPNRKLVKEHESDGKLRLTGVVPPLYGGPNGVAWDDGMYSGVREITVASGVYIDSIRVVYDKDGERVNADKHGGDGGGTNPQVILMYPNEFLVSVSGTYFSGRLRSLKFKSNKKAFGPFGLVVGTPFKLTVEDGGQIVGMKGRSDRYLDAIGVHISYAPKRIKKIDAPASDSSSSTVHMNYDVFLSFRGPDTRKTFTGHLRAALQRKGIITFMDSENLEKGTPISVLLEAIETSKLSIVIFSKGYAFSTWCLKELAKIMECMDSKKQIVMPVFYEINPAEIRHQTGPFKEAFDKHEEDERQSPEIMQKWRLALTKAATLSGWTSDDFKDDLRLVEDIATKILTRLKPSN